MIFRFATGELDLSRVVLRRDGQELRIEPQAFNVLAYLIDRRGEVVRKVDLLESLEPCRQGDGSYRFRNDHQFVIAQKR